MGMAVSRIPVREVMGVEKRKINGALSDITLSAEPNKMVIVGCVATIGKASTSAPCGADGKLVAFTQEGIEACGQSFEGMPLNCTYPDGWFAEGTDLFTNHGVTNIGFIRRVYAREDKLMAEIVVWKDKFPDEAYMIVNGMSALGFSLEWYAKATHEEDNVVFMDEFEGCGCAILWQNCAAFSDTFIEKLAAAKGKEGDDRMTNEEKEALVKEIAASVTASLEERLHKIEEGQEKMQGQVDDMKAAADKAEEEANPEPSAGEDEGEGAEEVPPVPQAAQHVEPNPNLDGGDDREAKLAEIKAADMSPLDKIREITKLRMQG